MNNNFELYRNINNLRIDEKFDELIELCKKELIQMNPNNQNIDNFDFLFIIGRFVETLCIKFGLDGFIQSIDILKKINYTNDWKNQSQIKENQKIIIWLNDTLWQFLFQNENIQIYNSNRLQILINMLQHIPKSWINIRKPIINYIKNNYNQSYNDENDYLNEKNSIEYKIKLNK